MSSAETTALKSFSDHDLRVPCFCEENAWRLVYRHLYSDSNSSEITDQWDYFVVFISNKDKCCPMFRQKIYPIHSADCVYWDYHVIVIRSSKFLDSFQGNQSDDDSQRNARVTEVLDIDSWLTPYPCPLNLYLDETFPHAVSGKLEPFLSPTFRVIPAMKYFKYFYSDRMHMFKDGRWSSPPPPYEPIMNGLKETQCQSSFDQSNVKTTCNKSNGSNLDCYINMRKEDLERSRDRTTSEKNELVEAGDYGEVLPFADFLNRFSGRVS